MTERLMKTSVCKGELGLRKLRLKALRVARERKSRSRHTLSVITSTPRRSVETPMRASLLGPARTAGVKVHLRMGILYPTHDIRVLRGRRELRFICVWEFSHR